MIATDLPAAGPPPAHRRSGIDGGHSIRPARPLPA